MGFPDKKVKFLGWKRRRFLQQGVNTVKLGLQVLHHIPPLIRAQKHLLNDCIHSAINMDSCKENPGEQ